MKFINFRSSYFWAALIALTVLLWMLSGTLGGRPGGGAPGSGASVDAGGADLGPTTAVGNSPRVTAVKVVNRSVERIVRASGFTEPEAIINLAAETSGTVARIPGRDGRRILRGQAIVALDSDTLPAQIAAARAELEAARASLESASDQSIGTYEEERAAAAANLEVARQRLTIGKKLADKEFTAPVELAQLRANFENARVALARIDLAKNHNADIQLAQNRARVAAARSNLVILEDRLEKSTFTSPIDGWLESVHVDIGEQVNPGAPVATVIGIDTLKVVVAVPQTSVAKVSLGDAVHIEVAGRDAREGNVTKISSLSGSGTRTFDVEVAIPNEDLRLRAGMTVEAAIDIGTEPAFAMSPAHLSVTQDGALAAKISQDGLVRVVPVELVRSGNERVFVSGLRNGDVLLTFGQAFVQRGDRVDVALEPAS